MGIPQNSLSGVSIPGKLAVPPVRSGGWRGFIDLRLVKFRVGTNGR